MRLLLAAFLILAKFSDVDVAVLQYDHIIIFPEKPLDGKMYLFFAGT